MFIRNITDDLLQHVVNTDQTSHATVFIDNNRHVISIVTKFVQQHVHQSQSQRAVGADAALNPGQPDPDQSGFADGAAMPAGMER